MALSGDTLAVAAWYEDSCSTSVSGTVATDNDCSGAGAAYVYTRSGTTWSFHPGVARTSDNEHAESTQSRALQSARLRVLQLCSGDRHETDTRQTDRQT